MKVRNPRIDYSQVRPHWAPNHEFAHDRNASSTIPTYIEPWLIKVMQQANAVLPEEEAELHALIDWFNVQEGLHTRQHSAFNRRIRDFYPAIAPLEQKLKADLDEFLSRRSLKFNLAYAEGFESLGPPSARLWFEKSDAFLAGADYEAVALWKWHMAEEFEHREVCFRLYKTLFAQGLWGRFWNGWLYRVYGFCFAVRHLGAYTSNVRSVMIQADRATMTAEELARSRENGRAVARLMRRHFLPQLLLVFLPFYNPGRKRPPKDLDAYLARFEKDGDMGRDQPLPAGAP